jgi:hypothetical protein
MARVTLVVVVLLAVAGSQPGAASEPIALKIINKSWDPESELKVVGVIYEDATYEGDPAVAAAFFAARAAPGGVSHGLGAPSGVARAWSGVPARLRWSAPVGEGGKP